MFLNKFKHYIEEPELLNSKWERIDFLELKNYTFEKEKELLNTIFSIFNDSIIKWIDYNEITRLLESISIKIHNLYWVEKDNYDELTLWNYDIYVLWQLFNILVRDNEIVISINNINLLLDSFIWDLHDSYLRNDLTRNSSDIVLSQLEDKYKILKNAKDIEDFFNDFKEFILGRAIRWFQVWYNEKKEEYRKLIFFKWDYKWINFKSFDKDQDISDFLRELQKENILLWYDYIDEYIDDKDWLIYNHLFNIKLKNGVILELNTIWWLREEIKWIFFSFKEKSFEILDFFEKLYAYRKNHIVENTKWKVENILDLLDVSPFNNRLNEKNISRANLVIRDIEPKAYSVKWISKAYFTMWYSKMYKYRKLIDAIISRQTIWSAIFESDFEDYFFDQWVLKNNSYIEDFIYKRKSSSFVDLKIDWFKIIEVDRWIIEYWLDKYYLDLDTFEEIKDIDSYTNNSVVFISEEEAKNIKEIILENREKFTKETFEDHWKKLEHIPVIDIWVDWEYYISWEKVVDMSYDRPYNQQQTIVDTWKSNDPNKQNLIIPDIQTLIHLVLKDLDKINKVRWDKILRFRSSTKVPDIDKVYKNREEYEDIVWEYYEVVIWDPEHNWKIDIDTWSWEFTWELGWETCLLSVFKKDKWYKSSKWYTLWTWPR